MDYLAVNKKNMLCLDALVWTVAGALCILFPGKLLSLNTTRMSYDNIHLHMTRAFGLFLIYSATFSHFAGMSDNQHGEYDRAFKVRLGFSGVLLLLMIYDNMYSKLWNMNHVKFGMVGLVLSMFIPAVGLYVRV
jgi:hypothetical protein